MTTTHETNRRLLAGMITLFALGCSPAPAAKTREPEKTDKARSAKGMARGASPLDKLTAPSLAEQTFDDILKVHIEDELGGKPVG